MDPKLPNHPFVPFRQIFKNVAQKHIPSRIMRGLFLFFCSVWYTLARIAKPEKRIQDCFARGENGYHVQFRRFPSIFSPSFSALCLLNDEQEEPPAKKATKVIVGALRFRARLQSEELQLDYEGGRPLDMQRYAMLFSRISVGSLQGGAPAFELTEMPPSEHVIVAIDGIFYKLRVMQDQQILPAITIHEQLCALLRDAKAQLDSIQSARFPFGLLTTLQNKQTIQLISTLRHKCPTPVQDLDNALFFVAIDLHDCPRSRERVSRVMHVQNFHSRDYRRSIQFVITGNSRAGIIGDPMAGIGGSFLSRLLDELRKESVVVQQELAESASAPAGPPLYQLLVFDAEFLAPRQALLAKLEQKVRAQIYPIGYDTVFRIEGVGRADFAPHKVSIDGAFHAALHRAFRRCFGKTPDIGNFIGLRSVQHGEIYRYNSSTPQMRQFAEAPSLEAARAALDAHKALVKVTKQATEDFYQCSMMLWTMASRQEVGLFSSIYIFLVFMLFVKGFRRRFVSQDMWVSHILECPGLAMTGRAGTLMPYLDGPALAGHYLIFDHHMSICFVSNTGKPSYRGQERKFANELLYSLRELRQLFEQPPAASPK